MQPQTHPTFGNGKICYLEIPSVDIHASATFYETVFGWKIRRDQDGNVSFDDGVGEVSGMWITNRKPATEPGVMISIMVTNLSSTIELINTNDGKILQEPTDPSAKTAVFSDPSGNVFCLYQSGRGK